VAAVEVLQLHRTRDAQVVLVVALAVQAQAYFKQAEQLHQAVKATAVVDRFTLLIQQAVEAQQLQAQIAQQGLQATAVTDRALILLGVLRHRLDRTFQVLTGMQVAAVVAVTT
jgi:hypothetical protein